MTNVPRAKPSPKLLLAAAMGVALLSSGAATAKCYMHYASEPFIETILARKGGVPISDALCAKLNKGNMNLELAGNSSVLAGVSVGWAYVTVTDRTTKLTSAISSSSTIVNSRRASMEVADEAFYRALENALDLFEADKAAADLKARAR